MLASFLFIDILFFPYNIISNEKGAFMKSLNEQYLELEKWYKRQERKTFLKYCIINLFKK